MPHKRHLPLMKEWKDLPKHEFKRTVKERVQEIHKTLERMGKLEDYLIRDSDGRIIVSLVEARELLFELSSWLGEDRKQLNEKLEKQLHQFNYLKDVFQFSKQNKRLDDIKRFLKENHGVVKSDNTIRNWLSKKNLPRFVSPSYLKAFLSKRKSFHIEEKNHPKFAYLLGSLFGNAYFSGDRKKISSIVLTNKSIDYVKRFSNFLNDLFEERPEILIREIKGKTYYWVKINSRAIAQLINMETEYFRKIPENFLDSGEAKKEFIKALIDSRGGIVLGKKRIDGTSRLQGITIHFPKSENLRDYVRAILNEFGIAHNFREKSELIVISNIPENLQKFNELFGFTDKRKQEILKEGLRDIEKS